MALKIYENVIAKGDKESVDQAVDTLINHTRSILSHGFLAQLEKLLEPLRIPIEELPKLLEQIDEFFRFDCDDDPDAASREYQDKVKAWRLFIIPKDFHSKVVTILGSPGHHFQLTDKKDKRKDAMQGLAAEFFKNKDLLRQELPWLTSTDAKSSEELGRALGETMAVTMLIGNANIIPTGLFSPGNSMASIIANQFGEADGLKFSSLIAIGLLLFAVTAVVNAIGKVIIRKFA